MQSAQSKHHRDDHHPHRHDKPVEVKHHDKRVEVKHKPRPLSQRVSIPKSLAAGPKLWIGLAVVIGVVVTVVTTSVLLTSNASNGQSQVNRSCIQTFSLFSISRCASPCRCLLTQMRRPTRRRRRACSCLLRPRSYRLRLRPSTARDTRPRPTFPIACAGRWPGQPLATRPFRSIRGRST